MFKKWKEELTHFLEKYETHLDILFFIAGFVFDTITLSDVDDIYSLVQQVIYLLMVVGLLHYEILFRTLKWRPFGHILKLWSYRNFLLHFFLGSLLSIYSLFYIKSSSFVSSLLFLVVMVGILLANELPVVRRSKVSLKVGLYAICLLSFVSIMYPLLIGSIGWIAFGLSMITTFGLLYTQFKILQNKLHDSKILISSLLGPGVSVLVIFGLFYALGWIPPVPLSSKFQGVYHLVEKKQGDYYLSFEKKWWKFWQSQDDEFLAQPDDRIYFYLQIYSPVRISGEVFIHWLFQDKKGNWQSSDRIPIKIVGGRNEGYRGYTMKSNYQPGKWRVQVETSIGQEISRVNFEVTSVAKDDGRNFEIIKK